MSMRLRIDHHTGFRYASTVLSSYNEARMTPASAAGQNVWSSRLSVEPLPWSFTYTDYWGSTVTAFEVHEPHDELRVQARSLVEIFPTTGDPAELSWDAGDGTSLPDDLDWAGLGHPAISEEFSELLQVTPRTEPGIELAERARELADELPPRVAALGVCRLLRKEVAYVPGSTRVSSHAVEAWDVRQGVCQDFAHLAVGSLRTLGIPARYVSGYLHPKREPVVGKTVPAESHAWIEFYVGRWVPYDVTNTQIPGDRHVVVARGRDYNDVSPLRGIYSGGASTMFVSVEMTRLT